MMTTSRSLNVRITEYKKTFASGEIQETYQRLVAIVQNIRTDFSKTYSDEFSVANVLHGYIDFTYFYLQDDYLKRNRLKLAIVFNHQHANFELWLLGQTKDVQTHYWTILRETEWINGKVMPEYSILEVPLLATPDFDNSADLIKSIRSEFNKLKQELFTTLKAYD